MTPDDGAKSRMPVLRAKIVVGVFFFGIALSFIRERSSPLWPTGLCLMGAGALALVWRAEVAELNRRLRESSVFQISEIGHHLIAVVWGLGVFAMGVALLVVGVGGCG